MRVRAGVDQLHIHVKPGADSPDAALQHMGDSQLVTDLTHILLAAIAHHAGSADHFQVGDFCKLGQNVVLHTIDECRGLLLPA